MPYVRLRWRLDLERDTDLFSFSCAWLEKSDDVQRALECVVETANQIYGKDSYWIEEVIERPSSASASK